MRFAVALTVFIAYFPLAAQIQLIPIAEERTGNARISSVRMDTLQLPFWEDFSGSPSIDTTKWRYGKDVFINNTQAIQAPTQNVASFDGLNELGFPHLGESEFNGPGDSLVSQAIDLSIVEKEEINSVFLSFYWQMKGRGDLPSDEDSLRLQFLDRTGSWVTQDINPAPDHNGLSGGISNLIFDEDSIQSFTQVILPVSEQFQHEGFQFKFESFSSLNGYYDTWHIDYIYLNKNRTDNDILHFDRSISNLEQSLFYPYISLPVDQFQNEQQYLSREVFALNNLDDSPHPARYSYQITNLISGSQTEQLFVTPDDMRPLEIGRFEPAPMSILPSLEGGDSIVLESQIHYITGDKRLFEQVDINGDTLFLQPDLTINDTLRTRYTLHNYLAYDDGTAEVAAGINLNQGQIASKFYVSTADTLTDVLIYFPPIFPNAVGESVTIRIWSELNNLALTREFGGVIEATTKNEFQQFTLQTPLIVRDTFYIGFQQFTDNYIGVGLDKNNAGGSDKIYSNTNREWVQNDRIIGSLMIRPVFRNAGDYVLSVDPDKEQFTIFPNPATEQLFFNKEADRVQLYTLTGKTVFQCSKCKEIDLSSLERGVYIVSAIFGDSLYSEQIIIR
jgi:hypothetical protein